MYPSAPDYNDPNYIPDHQIDESDLDFFFMSCAMIFNGKDKECEDKITKVLVDMLDRCLGLSHEKMVLKAENIT